LQKAAERKTLNEECHGKGAGSKVDECAVQRKQAYEEEKWKCKARMSKIKRKIAVHTSFKLVPQVISSNGLFVRAS
jgi:hypothetical protein